ncbi:MAG TPA: HWE histidine kinase domain-containing protein, partial [Hyphomicrobiaceae bacterium]|nr:HWE histidine kinase domain-containing protein [Hyphomicrobiaceae bacterium]
MTSGSDVEVELTTILEGIGEGFYSVDGQWTVRRFNREAARHFGRSAADIIGRNLWDTFPGARETSLGQLFLDTMDTRQTAASETESVIFPGRWLQYRLFPLGDGIGVVFRDISDRKRAEQQRDLLIRELHHRVNNTLANARAIAKLSFRDSMIDTDALSTFEQRLVNLSKANSMLTSERWESVGLRELISTTLAPFGGRFHLNGPDLHVRSESAVALSMALHELSTNAAKYGALSLPSGSIGISWSVAGDRFHLSWDEEGGPPVTPPSRKGFGSLMLERVLAGQIQGNAEITYRAEGVCCT